MNNPAEWRPSGSRFNLRDDSSYNLEEASFCSGLHRSQGRKGMRHGSRGAQRPKTGGQISGTFGKFKRDGSFFLAELKRKKPSNPPLCPSPGLGLKETKSEAE